MAERSYNLSRALYEEARGVIPGGVNSPARAFAAVGGEPLFIESGSGCRVTDVDGNSYVDYIGSWGPLILGHAHPDVVQATSSAVQKGTSFGAATRAETDLARRVRAEFPSMQKLRLVSSGTEATMSAVRLARGATGRDGIVKCDGCYHGHVDALLASAGSGAATLGIPGSAGVPEAVVARTHVVPYNDAEAVARVLAAHAGEIACVIVEPVAGNMGCVPPAEGYLQALRKITREQGVLLIFDEVMTGFRVAAGGAQRLYGVEPDLTTLGKIVGGGLPVGAYGGSAEVMGHVAPDGPVYQAGTLSGNPVAVAAGNATLGALEAQRAMGMDPYARLDRMAATLSEGLLAAARDASVPARINRVGSMWTLFFTDGPVTDFASAKKTDADRFGRFFRGMRDAGVLLPPSPYEAAFVSLAHDDQAIRETVEAARIVLAHLD